MDDKTQVLTDLIRHIAEVQGYLSEVTADLIQRGIAHDLSKYEEVEFDSFVETRPRFKNANYGTPEYKAITEEIRPAIDHHYSVNRHHTKFFKTGFAGMNLIDILEMLADWRAASRRSPILTFLDSLPKAFEMYKIPANMQEHILATLKYLKWAE